jgi:hypothetical protein
MTWMKRMSKSMKLSDGNVEGIRKQRYRINFRSIKGIVIAMLVFFTLIVFAVQISFSFNNFNKLITEEVHRSLQIEAERQASGVNEQFEGWGEASSFYALTIASSREYNTELSIELLKKYMEKDALIVGGGFWLEPYEYSKEEKYYAPYLYRDGGNIEVSWDYSNEEANYYQYDWYQNGIQSDKPVVWSEPYADAVTDVPMITSSSVIVKDGKQKECDFRKNNTGMVFLTDNIIKTKIPQKIVLHIKWHNRHVLPTGGFIKFLLFSLVCFIDRKIFYSFYIGAGIEIRLRKGTMLS